MPRMRRQWVEATYNRAADGYDAAYGRGRYRRRAAIFDRGLLEAARGCQRVLEIGVGTGRLLRQVNASARVGIDVSTGMLRRCPAGLWVARADAHELPFADGSFDCILSAKAVFRYLDLDAVLGECQRVLRPGGWLAVHQLARRTWSLRPSRHSIDERHWNSEHDLVAPAARLGFVLESVERWRSVRFPPYALRIPPWLPGRWWRHINVVMRRS